MAVKQLSNTTHGAKDSQGIKKCAGRRHTYVVTLSDDNKKFLSLVITKQSAQLVKSPEQREPS